MGPLPGSWLAACMADLTPDLQVYLHLSRGSCMSVMRVDSQDLPLSAIPLCQLLLCHLGTPRPTLSINLYVKGCLDCTIGAFHIFTPAELSLLQNTVQILNAKEQLIGPCVDISCSLILQISLIIALSFCCRHWRFGFVNGQVSLAWSIALNTQRAVHVATYLEREVVGRENW